MKSRQRKLWEGAREGQYLIKQGFDISLNFRELCGLKFYIERLNRGASGERYSIGDALHLFMVDYFGVDTLEFISEIAVPVNKKREHVPKRFRTGGNIHKLVPYGLGLFDNGYYSSSEILKEYCRRRVNYWRDRKTLL